MSLKFVRQLFIFSMLLKYSGFFLVQHMQFEVSIMFKAQTALLLHAVTCSW